DGLRRAAPRARRRRGRVRRRDRRPVASPAARPLRPAPRGGRLVVMTSTPAPENGPVVATRAGRVRGIRRADGTTAFLGIPFAQAPIGALRFAAPVPPAPWEGVRDATAYGPTPLRVDDESSLIPEPAVPGDATLNVNVFTPHADADAALPVVV